MAIGVYASANYDVDGPILGENCWGEEGMGRTGKYDHVKDVDVKVDGEGLALH